MRQNVFLSQQKKHSCYWVDFSSVILNPGAKYTAIISNETPRWGVRGNTSNTLFPSDVYTEGNAIVSGQVNESADLRFRVLAQTQPVPEPLTVAGSGLAFAGLMYFKRRQQKTPR